jgi:hypothetical protein
MTLEHGLDPVSAKWNKEKNGWEIGEKKKFRWNDTSDQPQSDWFYDIGDALNWIIEYDSKISR